MNEHVQGNPIRLVLFDEFALFRASLSRYLASEAGFQVVGQCGTSAEALETLKDVTADVILLDFAAVAEHDDFISAARERGYQGRFLIVVGTLDVRKLAFALKLGATGVFLKSEALERLVQAIQLVANGEVWVDQKVIQLLAEQFFYPYPRFEDKESLRPLEDRERNVLLGIVKGLTNRKIGDGMGLSESSVKNIVQRLFGIAGVKTRGQLVRAALDGSLNTTNFIGRDAKEATTRSHAGSHESRSLVGANLTASRNRMSDLLTK
jgi:two-component system, NarL family, response regulator NreC